MTNDCEPIADESSNGNDEESKRESYSRRDFIHNSAAAAAGAVLFTGISRTVAEGSDVSAASKDRDLIRAREVRSSSQGLTLTSASDKGPRGIDFKTGGIGWNNLRMRITQSGHVGIGTDKPGDEEIDLRRPILDVAGYASFNGLRVGLDGVNDILSENQEGLTLTAKGSDKPDPDNPGNTLWHGGLRFRTGDNKVVRMRITPDGRIGMGNDAIGRGVAQDVRLHVVGHQLVQGPEGYGENGQWDKAYLYMGDKGYFVKAEHDVGISVGVYGTDPASGPIEPLFVQGYTGNVGIGTKTPEATLHVAGNIIANDVMLRNADVAEEFSTADTTAVEPGSVMVIEEGTVLRQCTQAYDTKAIGVVSGAGNYKPALLLDRQTDQSNRLPIALMGKVECKVDASTAPIEMGDLLTTSATPGHAMKAADPMKAFGAVIGKALGRLESGTGMIPILVTLQ